MVSVAFSPDVTHLATASRDGTVIIWPIFPWNEQAYPGGSDQPLEDSIELYKRECWKTRQAPRDHAG